MKTPTLILSAFVLMTAFTLSAHAQGKIVVVDLSKVLKEYNRYQTAEKDLKAKADKATADIQEMAGSYAERRDGLQKLEEEIKAPGLSEAARNAKKDDFSKRYQDFRQYENKLKEFQQNRQQLFQQEALRVRSELVRDITNAVSNVGANERCTMIFDRSAMAMSGTNVVLYASSDTRDLSDDVIRMLNSAAPARASGSAPGMAPRPTPVTPRQ